MKKGAKVLFALVVISAVLFSFISFASAGWFSDFIGKITGYTTAPIACVNQGCDNNTANGIVDAGKSCAGTFTTWYQNNSIQSIGRYAISRPDEKSEWISVKDGDWIFYDNKGSIISKETYKGGIRQ